MSTNTPIIFIGIPYSNPHFDDEFQTFVSNALSHIHVEPITLFENKNIPQWNFIKAYFIHITPNDPKFNILISEFGGNSGSDLDDILLGYNTKQHYLDMFETLLEYAQ